MASGLGRQVKRGLKTVVRDGDRKRASDCLDEARVHDIVAHIGDFPGDPDERSRFNEELRTGKPLQSSAP